jgi:hypothetical protein
MEASFPSPATAVTQQRLPGQTLGSSRLLRQVHVVQAHSSIDLHQLTSQEAENVSLGPEWPLEPIT